MTIRGKESFLQGIGENLKKTTKQFLRLHNKLSSMSLLNKQSELMFDSLRNFQTRAC